MQEKLNHIVNLMLKRHGSDLHLIIQGSKIRCNLRCADGMERLESAMIDHAFFHYLKYLANLDLGNMQQPQSGSFQFPYHDQMLYFRFSLICNNHLQTGVLRILNNHPHLTIEDLTEDAKQQKSMYDWTKKKSGMVILSGPTGSGKTTTLHTLLQTIAKQGKLNIISLEDPIEIMDQKWIQLAVNERAGFTYEEGIKQLLRHDPDVIMLGEIRDPYTAKMAYRSALTGHMVYSTVHARHAKEAIKRLNELGLSNLELQDTLTAVCSQRLYPQKHGKQKRVCIYEILEGNNLHAVLCGKEVKGHLDIYQRIYDAVQKNCIDASSANADLSSKTL